MNTELGIRNEEQGEGEGQTGWDGGPLGRRKGAGPLPAWRWGRAVSEFRRGSERVDALGCCKRTR